MQTLTYPAAPAVTPLKGTLLDVATVNDDYANMHPLGMFDTFNCMKFGASTVFCGPQTKDLDQSAGWISGFRFGVYGGATCKPIGLDQAKMLAEISRVFRSGESTAVERALMETRFAQSAADVGEDLDAGDLWDAPIDLTPAGGAVSPKVGVAILEGYASNEYVGAPTLHLPVTIASILSSSDGIVEDGRILRTHLGSKVVAGAGYDFPNTGPTGANAAAGEKWLYATGEVLVIRGPEEIRPAMDHINNDVTVLAERPYIAAVDCFAAAIRVTVS